jgi:hypothetical protein
MIENENMFREYGTSLMKEGAGIAFDGVILTEGTNDYKVDIFNPVVWPKTGYYVVDK